MGSTRREFLGAGATLAVGTALGGSLLGCRSDLDFDVCVIGSGFAGTHVALEAVEAGWRTLILEAGSRRNERPRDPRFGGAFEFRHSGDIRWPVNRARAIAVGGTQPEIEPRAENRVRLSSKDLDENGTPLPVVELSYSERDQQLFAEGRQVLVREAKPLSGNGASSRRRHNWRKHPAGVCRMGFSPATGVVDSDCRVFGLDNLFVSGASVFPTNRTSNPTLTVVAVALRLADHLIGHVL